MISLTFPDGAARRYQPGINGIEIAKGISPSLAKRTVAMASTASWLISPIRSSATPRSNSRPRGSPRARAYPPRCGPCARRSGAGALSGTQVTIGPVIENGFYYDFFRNEPFTPEDFPAIEKKMREIIARDSLSPRRSGRAIRPKPGSRSMARPSRSNWSMRFRPTRI